ncbi:MAG: hypothetical protein ACFCVB_20525 [Nodosilinea sp.]
MTSLDDLTLMQWFVSGDATLEANQSLRIQPANKLRQLLGRRGTLLATAYDTAMPPSVEVRRGTDYSAVLHQILIDHHFVPIGQGLDSQVLCYAHYPIPDGYRIVYGQARQLWKQWWTHPSQLNNRHLQLDLFMLAEKQWYPVRNIAINIGTLYVETMRGETVHHGDDMVVWLEKDRDEVDHTCLLEPPVPQAVPQAEPIQQVKKLPPPSMTPSPRPAAPAPAIAAPQATVDPTLAPTVYALDGKVYVQTAVGLVIIEGDNLKAYSPAPRRAAVSQPLRQSF